MNKYELTVITFKKDFFNFSTLNFRLINLQIASFCKLNHREFSINEIRNLLIFHDDL